ncbi:VacJ family lipoprotein [Tropicibacter naphthalenivorans]|uniref:Putative phospholipid-binding lipoprotein MlaA n=1 Tax=Tropicibacter naphthalenivorans TaxID=441103 RepID=A0A0P1GAF3_9RHOB|nr:VacJ family lipoprotein [Tropicibacter naphthalenivorans]CUH78413.1 putative phospholipid-binding lipoprotein MlaA precursor [Tropicibacter naphthalenivorans]SMC80260.1 phospholipid-binding lipoprotein MlaA [Tropicibacter naphthalenivorans]
MTLQRAFFAMALVSAAGACSVPGPNEAPDGIWDPYEASNRKIHAFNTGVDEKLLRGSGQGLSNAVPQDVRIVVGNFVDTTSLPKTVVNQVLQGRLGDATKNTLRFSINATMGFAGIFDVAADLGLPQDETDFGETLAVWGVPEGAYMELPLYGPSTERDTAGTVVDFFTNPLDYVLTTPQKRFKTGAWIFDEVQDRGQYSDTVDSVLYESADSYAQLRLMYLQNRRFELGEEPPASEEIDPLALDTEGF